jgi:phosphoglycerate dehydrogenase-like enzyme
LNLLLNVPYEFTAADRTALTSVCPNIRIESAPAELNGNPEKIGGREFDVLVTEHVPHDFDRWPNLRFVQLVSAGIDHLVGHPIWQRAIPVATASGIYSVPIAQFGTAAILSLAHRLRAVTEFTSTHNWPNRDSLAGSVVRGRTVGILGYGSIGRECGRQLHALGMRIFCMSRSGSRSNSEHFVAWPGTGDTLGEFPDKWYTPNQLPEMLPQCDVLLVTAPRTQDTGGLIGASQLAMLPRGSHVVILSRGGIVDERALADALRSGHVGAAWVDAYMQEPPDETHPLFDAPNITLSPHMSGVCRDYWTIFPRLLAENLRRLVNGERLLNIAHGELGY